MENKTGVVYENLIILLGDIMGSTELAKYGDYPNARSQFEQIISSVINKQRNCLKEYSGLFEGDAAVAYFPKDKANDAILTAVEMIEAWGRSRFNQECRKRGGLEVNVAIGIHIGKLPRDMKPQGFPIICTARIQKLASQRGEEEWESKIYISKECLDKVSQLSPDLEAKDLGIQKLTDIPSMHLFEITKKKRGVSTTKEEADDKILKSGETLLSSKRIFIDLGLKIEIPIKVFLKMLGQQKENNLVYFEELRVFVEKIDSLCKEKKITEEVMLDLRNEVKTFLKELYRSYIFEENKGKYYHREGSDEKFIDGFEKFELLLIHSKYYRDHFVHQFWVFLLGCCIINAYYDHLRSYYLKSLNIPEKEDEHFLDIGWLLCSTLHDYCYPIGESRDYLIELFKTFLPSTHMLFAVDLGKLLLEPFYIDNIDCLVSLFQFLNQTEGREKRWNYRISGGKNSFLRKIYIQRLAEFITGDPKLLKPHALLSALSILSIFVPYNDIKDAKKLIKLNGVVYPSALAISLHHLSPQELLEITAKKGINFSRNILTYLLVFCDNAQEWYRLFSQTTPEIEEEAELKDFAISGNVAKISLKWRQRPREEFLSYLNLLSSVLKNDIEKRVKPECEVKWDKGSQRFP